MGVGGTLLYLEKTSAVPEKAFAYWYGLPDSVPEDNGVTLILEEVRRRILSLKVDYLADSGQLQAFIEDAPMQLIPQCSRPSGPTGPPIACATGRSPS